MPSKLTAIFPLVGARDVVEYPHIALEQDDLAALVENCMRDNLEFVSFRHTDGPTSHLSTAVLRSSFITISAEEEEDDGEDSD